MKVILRSNSDHRKSYSECSLISLGLNAIVKIDIKSFQEQIKEVVHMRNKQEPLSGRNLNYIKRRQEYLRVNTYILLNNDNLP